MNVLFNLDAVVLLSLVSNFALWPLAVLQQKVPLWPKKHFPHRAALSVSRRPYKWRHLRLQTAGQINNDFVLSIYDPWCFFFVLFRKCYLSQGKVCDIITM